MKDWKKKFTIIWTGQLFSILSSAIVQFSIVLWISLKTGSAEVLAISTIAALLPQTLLGPFAGVYVDRWDRKITMIVADSFVALCSAVLALLFYLNVIEIWHIYLLLALRSIGSAFHSPAMQSSIPMLAPERELVRISGINQAIQSVCNIAGPALGAVLIMSFDMSFIMMIDVAGAFIACFALLFVAIPSPKPEKGADSKSVLREMKEGFNAIRNNRGMVWIISVDILVTFFVMPVGVLVPLMTLNHFGGDTYQVSLIEVLYGAGMLTGGIILGVWKMKIRKVILINLSYLLMGFFLVLTGLLSPTEFVLYAILSALLGAVMPFYSGPVTALIQTLFHPSVLGRVFSFFMSVSLLPALIGLLATGFIADAIGVANVFLISGIITTFIGAATFFIPDIMNIEKEKKN